MKSHKVTYMAQISLLAAIMLVLMFSGIGYIPVGPIRATTMHIPVIIGGIVLGPLAGGVLGLVFGITSVIQNTIAPTITSFVFSPFYSVGEGSGNFYSLIIAIVPRVLIGLVAAYAYRYILKASKRESVSMVAAGVLASMTNTILVMGGIYLFFGESYAAAKNIQYNMLLAAIGSIIGVNGVVEAFVAGIISFFVCRPLIKIFKRKS